MNGKAKCALASVCALIANSRKVHSIEINQLGVFTAKNRSGHVLARWSVGSQSRHKPLNRSEASAGYRVVFWISDDRDMPVATGYRRDGELVAAQGCLSVCA